MSRAGAALAALVILVELGVAPSLRAQAPAGGETMNKTSESERRAQDAIRAIEEEERQAVLRSDVRALERIWSDDLVVNAPNNEVKTKPEVLDLVKSGRLKYSSFERHIERISLHGDMAVAMGAETVVPVGGPDAGKTIQRRYTNVYTRQGGQWRLTARQATIVPQRAT